MDSGAWQATVIFSSHRKVSDDGVWKTPKDMHSSVIVESYGNFIPSF